MNEIRERAKGYIETLRNSKSAYIIAGLLAELERVENDTAKVKLAYAEGKITGRQQAARECAQTTKQNIRDRIERAAHANNR